jgi:hypothetical protein
MDPGSFFILLVLFLVVVGFGVVLFTVGGSRWKKQTDRSEPGEGSGEARPTHRVLDKRGNVVADEYSERSAPRDGG